MSIFSMHFHNKPVDDLVLDLIVQKPCLTAIDTPITFREVKHAINKLKNGKSTWPQWYPSRSPQSNGWHTAKDSPQNVSDFFDGTADHKGWHKSQCVPVPKKGDLIDPNKWQGIMLMDMCSKIFALVMIACAFKLLDQHGTCSLLNLVAEMAYSP